METLGKFSYKLFNKKPEELSESFKNILEDFEKENISESDFDQLNILLKKYQDKKYDFIHYSFQDFFLSRYLANKPNGEKSLYLQRDKTKDYEDWNLWRNLKPSILFFGEILINKKEEKRLDKFLSDKGILKNDDIFKHNLFIALEIIYKLNNNKKREEILKKFTIKINNFGKRKIFNLIFKIQEFCKTLNYIDNIFIDILLKEIKDMKFNSELIKLFVKIGTPKILNYFDKNIEQICSNSFDIKSILYSEIANIGTPEAIKIADKGGKQLLNINNNSNVRTLINTILGIEYINISKIYFEILKAGTPEAINTVKKAIKKLLEINDINFLGEIFIELAKITDKPKEKTAYFKKAESLAENISKIKNYNIPFEILKLVKNDNEKQQYYDKALKVYLNILEIKYYNIYTETLKITKDPIDHKNLIKYAKGLAENLGKNKRYKESANSYIDIAKNIIDNEEIKDCILKAKENAELLIGEKKFNEYEVLMNSLKGVDYQDAANIYLEIAKFTNNLKEKEDCINKTKNIAQKLGICLTYSDFILSHMSLLLPIHCNNVIRIYLEIAKITDDFKEKRNCINIAKNGAILLSNIKEFNWFAIINKEIAKITDDFKEKKESLKNILSHTDILFEINEMNFYFERIKDLGNFTNKIPE